VSASPPRLPPWARPPSVRRRSPWLRVGLVTALIVSLPFSWSENASCDGKPQPLVSGGEILFGHGFDEPAPGLIFLGLLVVVTALGFLVRATARPWLRLAGQVVAGLAALGTTFMCGLMMTQGRPEQPLDHPAAWLGTLSALALTLDAWWGAGDALWRGLARRRAKKRRIAAGDPARLRIATARDRGGGERDEEEEEEAEGEKPALRRRQM
jgi:hypothetical protein